MYTAKPIIPLTKPCPDCRHENPASAKFCIQCGTNLAGLCPACRTRNSAQARFCLECGTNLSKTGAGLPEQPAPEVPRRPAERRQLTILFCDLVGSTALSERLDPEDYRQVILGYQVLVEQIVARFGGHVAQYLGDGLLVYFGYPNGLEDASKAGVQAGLEILQAVRRPQRTNGRTPIEVRIGIHTGLVIVDDHLALGAATNIAARLQGLAPINSLVISPQTLKLIRGWFEVESLGEHDLKGISDPVEVFRVLHESDARTRLEVARRHGFSPLVGRQPELDLLTKKWQQAKAGQGNLALLRGEPGIGKSRLADTLRQQVAKDPDSICVTIHCSAHHQHSAFHPVIDLLETEILAFEREEPAERKLAKLEAFVQQSGLDTQAATALLAEFLSIASEQYPPLNLSPMARKQRIMESLTRALLGQKAHWPLLLIVEDLHWADASTLEWLQLFLEYLPERSIFLLCTTRPSFHPNWTERQLVTTLSLERLSPELSDRIARRQAKGKELPREILDKIYAKTEGIPLFVEELTKMVLESGLLREAADHYVLTEASPALTIPSTLQDSLLARLDQLSAVKEVVQLGSVLGREFSLTLLSAILRRKEGELQSALAQLTEAEILFQRGKGKQAVYRFKHALIQDAAYQSMLKTTRQKLHQAVAAVLEDQFPDTHQHQPELIAFHYTEAALPGRAVPLWLRAGRQASRRHANQEAVAHLEKGLALLPQLPDEEEHRALELDFLLTLGGALIVYYGYTHPEVRDVFSRARAVAQTVAVSPQLAFVLYNLQTYYLLSERAEALNELIDYALEAGEQSEQGYLFTLFARHNQGAYAIEAGDFARANRLLGEAVDLYDPSVPIPVELTPGGDVRINAASWRSVGLQIAGYPEQARRISEHHLSLADQHRDSRTLYHIYGWVAWRGLEAREWAEVARHMDTYLPIAREFGDPFFVLVAETYYHIARAYQGDRLALETALGLVDAFLAMGTTIAFVVGASFIAELHYRFGEHAAALDLIERACEHVDATGSHLHTAEFYRIRGRALSALGRPDSEVEETYQKAIDLARRQSAKTFELRAATDLAGLWKGQGKVEEARQMLREVYAWFGEGEETVDLREARGVLEGL